MDDDFVIVNEDIEDLKKAHSSLKAKVESLTEVVMTLPGAAKIAAKIEAKNSFMDLVDNLQEDLDERLSEISDLRTQLHKRGQKIIELEARLAAQKTVLAESLEGGS